jgi:UDP-N-acetylglucosamine 2-epimerase (non-hydrolysing)
MSQIFFDEMKIPRPDENLGIGSDTHARQTGKIMIGVEKYLMKEKPDWVIVYGDTNSTMAAALAAVKLHIPVAHIEAGLRSFNRKMPEEINRIVADSVSKLLLCPTETAVQNLAREGITENVHNVGDVMFDAALRFAPIAEEKSNALERFGVKEKEYFLLTLHRAENTDSEENMRQIISAVTESQEIVIFPAHPRTQKYLRQYGLIEKIKNAPEVILTEPVSFLDMILLEKKAKKILTDSGGVQKEAYFYKVPCITLRTETEWVETVEDGWNRIVGSEYNLILEAMKNFSPNSQQKGHYGDGHAAEKICEIMENF